LGLPYLALFDSLHFYDACIHALEGYDILYERLTMLSIGGALAARRLGVPLVLEVNADPVDELDSIGEAPRGIRRAAARLIFSFCLHQSAAIVVVSSQLKAHLMREWGLSGEKITVLPNGVDVELFEADADPRVARASLDLPEAPTVVFVGGFYPWHALLELLESFVLVHQRSPDARLYLVGDGPMRSTVQACAQRLNLGDCVTFVGSVPHVTVPRWLSAADVAVAPFTAFSSGKGGSPLKLFEYMAAGRAIVATATGQVKEIMRDGEDCLLVEPGNRQGFAEAILALLRNREMRHSLGQVARKTAASAHSWSSRVSQLVDVYGSVIDRRERAGANA
jgi:glycosyltransferase involved in cell wall biosynthesis